jgi:hypothetical protein
MFFFSVSLKDMQLEAGPARAIFASMAGHVVIRITERLGAVNHFAPRMPLLNPISTER